MRLVMFIAMGAMFIVSFRLRNLGTLNRQRLVVAAMAAALIPVAVEVDAVVSVGLLAALSGSLIAYEAIHFREARRRVRSAARPE